VARNDFFKKTRALEKMVGNGSLVGTFVVNGGGRTVPLEVGYWRNYMGRNGYLEIRNYTDGGPHAVQKSLTATYATSLEDIARTTLETGPQEAMIRHVEGMKGEFQKRAPRVTGSYHESTARVVTDNGQPIHEEFDAHYGEEPR
jgi:accessory colonization factor AcfC